MTQEPSRSPAGRPARLEWTERPEGAPDEHGKGWKAKTDPQLIIAGLALIAAVVLVVLAF